MWTDSFLDRKQARDTQSPFRYGMVSCLPGIISPRPPNAAVIATA